MNKKLGLAAAVLVICVVADWLQEILYLSGAYRGLYERYPFYVPESLKSLLQNVLVITLGLAALLIVYGARRFGQAGPASQTDDGGGPYS